jgi:hypothetical protein
VLWANYVHSLHKRSGRALLKKSVIREDVKAIVPTTHIGAGKYINAYKPKTMKFVVYAQIWLKDLMEFPIPASIIIAIPLNLLKTNAIHAISQRMSPKPTM